MSDMVVGILGLGTVGKGVFEIINNDFKDITIKYILVRDKSKYEEYNHLLAKDINQIINDQEVETVLELIGGISDAYSYIKQSLEKKKNVITANKAVISKYYKELNELAIKNKVKLLFEASVGAAINIIDPLKTISKFNKINMIEGIINGSTNFVLSKIFKEDYPLEKALAEARTLGYIETGSNDDMDGLDLMRKINILSMIAYQQAISEASIRIIPLSSLNQKFYNYVKSQDMAIKYLATSIKKANKILIQVLPTIIGKSDFYNMINYEDNIVTLYGEYHKKQSFIGQGAGRYPTASAVIADLLNLTVKDDLQVDFKNSCEIDNSIQKYKFLIQKGNDFIKTDYVNIDELLNDKDIIALARIM